MAQRRGDYYKRAHQILKIYQALLWAYLKPHWNTLPLMISPLFMSLWNECSRIIFICYNAECWATLKARRPRAKVKNFRQHIATATTPITTTNNIIYSRWCTKEESRSTYRG